MKQRLSYLGLLVAPLWISSCGQLQGSKSQAAASAPGYESALIEVSKTFLAAGIERSVNERFNINENIDGVWVRGTSVSSGKVYMTLAPNARKAQMNIYYQGTTVNKTIGVAEAGLFHRKSVTIDSTTNIGLHSLKSVYFNEKGFALAPNKANYNGTITINDVTLYNGGGNEAILGQNMAWGRVEAEKGQYLAAAQQRAATTLNRQMDKEANKQFGEAHQKYLTKFYKPLIASGIYPGRLVSSSSANGIKISTQQIQEADTPEIAPRPQLSATDDVKFYLHQTLLNKITTKKFAGKKVNFADFKKELKDLIGHGGEPTEEDRNYAISFPEDKVPVEITFQDDELHLLIRSSGYYVSDVRQPSMDVTVKYRLSVSEDGKLKANRLGGIRIVPPGFRDGDVLSDRQRDLQRELRQRYAEEFKEELISESIKLPEAWEKSGKLLVSEVHAVNGWLTTGMLFRK